MTTTLLTGATGTLGTELRPRLRTAGHEVRAASRDPPDDETADEWVAMDLIEGTGVEAAVGDVDVVVHAASAPRGDTEAVDVRGTERLLDAAEDAGVSNFLYVSIVGVDQIPYSYFEHKVAAEELVTESPVPSTIVRETQFYPFVVELLDMVSWLPVWPVPTTWRLQPTDTGEAADAIVDHATEEASGRVDDVGGPEVRTFGELARAYRTALGKRRPIVRLPVPGSMSRAYREGKATCPERTVGTVTFEAWLADCAESA